MKSVQSQTEDSEVNEMFTQTVALECNTDQIVQTEDETTSDTFVKYPCNYCGINIANKYHLMEHIVKCRGTINMFTEPGLPKLPFYSFSYLQPPPPVFSNQYRF